MTYVWLELFERWVFVLWGMSQTSDSSAVNCKYSLAKPKLTYSVVLRHTHTKGWVVIWSEPKCLSPDSINSMLDLQSMRHSSGKSHKILFSEHHYCSRVHYVFICVSPVIWCSPPTQSRSLLLSFATPGVWESLTIENNQQFRGRHKTKWSKILWFIRLV